MASGNICLRFNDELSKELARISEGKIFFIDSIIAYLKDIVKGFVHFARQLVYESVFLIIIISILVLFSVNSSGRRDEGKRYND